jgi:protein-disulfide isomerase
MKLNKEIKTLSIIAISVIFVSIIIYFSLDKKEEPKITNIITAPVSKSLLNYVEGPIDAKVTVVEFFDPECESCAEISPYMKNEMKYYQGRVRWVFRYMAYHPSSNLAIHIIEAARKQNLYLDAVTLLLSKQNEWGLKHDGSEPKVKEKELMSIIAQLPGINLNQLKEDMKNPEIDRVIEIDKQEGTNAGVTGTPTLFVNDVIINPLNLDKMIEKINDGLK